jgi:mannosyltransferase
MTPRKYGEDPRSLSLQTTIWLVLVALGAASLRLFHLGLKSFWADEAFSITLAQSGWAEFRHALASTEANMALYYVLLRLWSHISDTPSFVRALSVLAGVATVPAIYFTGETLFSRRAGMIAALLLTVNVFHISYSQEARSYSLVVLLVTCSSLFFVRNVRSQGHAGGVWHISTSAAALYTHFFAALVLLAQSVSWILLPRQFRKGSQLRNMFVIATLGFPLVFFMVFQKASHLGWVQHPTAKEVYHLFTYFTGSGLKFLLFLLAVALASREWWLHRGVTGALERWSFVFVALWLLLPILVTLVVSHWKPILSPRFLLICLPPALLLFAQGLALIRPNWLCFAMLAVVICSSLVAVRSFYRKPGQEDWKAAISYLAKNAQPDDVLIFASAYCRFPFDYNLRMSGMHLPQMRVEVEDTHEAGAFSTRAHHLWVICGNAATEDVPQFRFRQALPFPGVNMQEFESDHAERLAGND